MKTLLATAIFASLSLPAVAGSTDNCSLQFKDDLIINPQGVSLQRAQTQLWHIDNQGQLWLEQQKVATNSQTTQALQHYQAGLRQQSQDTLLLVGDALILATDAVDRVVTGFGVESPQLRQTVDQMIGNLKGKIDHLVIKNGEEIRINGSHINQQDGRLEAEMEQAIEQSVAQLTGAMMMTMGQAMMQGDGNFEQRMADFGKKMETFGDQLEQEMDQRGDALEQRGQAICRNLQQLDQLEGQIQAAVPAMTAYDLIDTKKEGLKNPLKTAAGQTE